MFNRMHASYLFMFAFIFWQERSLTESVLPSNYLKRKKKIMHNEMQIKCGIQNIPIPVIKIQTYMYNLLAQTKIY